MNFIKELGTLALGTRIKNLSESLMKDMAKIYEDLDVDFEPRWFTFFQLALRKKEITVTQIANELNQTHPAVVQVINVLEKKKLIITNKDKSDNRKRLVKLNKKGKHLAKELVPLWEIVQQVSNEILNESAPDLLDKISEVENALQNKSTYQRVQAKLIRNRIDEMEFKEFDKRYIRDFRELNEHWLNSCLEITPYDRKVLIDPEKEIVQKNGYIYIAVSGKEVIGTYALKQLDKETCEILKFTVKEKYRRNKIGKRMVEHAIEKAKNKNYKSIWLITTLKLENAIRFYKNNGFEISSSHPNLVDETGRCSITMKLRI